MMRSEIVAEGQIAVLIDSLCLCFWICCESYEFYEGSFGLDVDGLVRKHVFSPSRYFLQRCLGILIGGFVPGFVVIYPPAPDRQEL